jgi:hypothetical protein
MKTVIIAASILFLFLPFVQAQHSLNKLWQTDSVVKVPESVLYDASSKTLFVSEIDGAPDGKDGMGEIAKISTDGKIINTDWVTGLNAPKGLGKFGNTLYVADLTEVVAIDIPTAKIIAHIPVEGASFLNDITVDKNGVVYVSDSRTNKLHKIENGVVTTYATNFTHANGVLAVGSDLYVLANGSLFKIDPQHNQTTIASGMDNSTDGVEQIKPGEFIVSSWSGIIYYVTADGKTQQLLDTRNEKSNTADIGYDAVNKIVYVPTFFKKSVAAYQLK